MSDRDFTELKAPGVEPKITSIFDFTAESLGQLRAWLETHPFKIPFSSVTGFSQTTIPPGSVFPYAGASAPASYLLCDGGAVDRITYAALFAAIGVSYGPGDGTSTFNLPDLRGRMPVGLGTHVDVNALGDNDGVAVANRRPKHRHTPHAHTITMSSETLAGGGFTTFKPSGSTSTSSVDGGSGNANDSLDAPAYLTLQFIIKT